MKTSGIVERVAEVDKARGLVGGVVVEDAAELLGLVGDDSCRAPAEPREAGDDRLGPLTLDVEELAVVDDPLDHLVHVIRLAVGVRQHVEQRLLAAVDRVAARKQRRRGFAVLRHVGEVGLDLRDALLVACDLHVADAGLAAVHARAAQFLLGDVLPDRRAHEMRPGERHRAAPLDHRHEVGEPGDVCGPGRARAHQRGDQRDHAAHHDLLAEQVPGAGEHRARGLLYARARGVEQPHERDALAQRELAQAPDLELAGHAHRAGHHREVVRADRGQAAVDLAVARDHAVGGGVDVVHRALRGMRACLDAELDERALIDEQRDPLARRQLFALVLQRDLLGAAALHDLRAARLQLLDQRAQQGAVRCFDLAGHRQRPFQTGSRFSKKALTPSTMSSVESASVSWARR